VSDNRDSVVLETNRLLMRPPERQDFDAYAEFLGDEIAAKHLGGAQPRSLAWRSFAAVVGAWHIQGFAMFSVIEKASGRWVGRVGPWQPEGWPGTEVGWGIVRDCWGRGYATEAATAAIDWAFDTLDWTDVIHIIDTGNAASQAVARRLGSQNRGRVKMCAPHEDAVVDLWGQTREEWRTRRASST
jgi:RimJ/RimL family protein N-acetyltransferase